MKRDQSLTVRLSEPGPSGLAGKFVAVVGGTGGIGRAIARDLAARGAEVIVVGQTFRDQATKGIRFLKRTSP